MKEPLRLTVLTPAEMIWEADQVRWVQVQLADGGGLGIWPGHTPLLAETVTAPLRYADDTGEQAVDLVAGLLQIESGEVTIFTSGFAEAADRKGMFGKSSRLEEKYGRLARTLLTKPLNGIKDDDA